MGHVQSLADMARKAALLCSWAGLSELRDQEIVSEDRRDAEVLSLTSEVLSRELKVLSPESKVPSPKS